MFSGLCHEHTRATLDTNGFTAILRNRAELGTGRLLNMHYLSMWSFIRNGRLLGTQ